MALISMCQLFKCIKEVDVKKTNEIISFCFGMFVGFILLSMYFSNASTVEFVSLLIATLAIFLTFYTLRESRRHNRLTVTPYLDKVSKYDEVTGKCGFYLINAGTGSAVNIRSTMFIDGVPASGGVYKKAHYKLAGNDDDFITYSSGQTTIMPNNEVCIYQIEIESKDKAKFAKAHQFMCKMAFEVSYESVLGEKKEHTFKFK